MVRFALQELKLVSWRKEGFGFVYTNVGTSLAVMNYTEMESKVGRHANTAAA